MLQNRITDIPGLRVGHATDLRLASGVTAILFDDPVVASVDVRGGGPGTRSGGQASWRAVSGFRHVAGFEGRGGSNLDFSGRSGADPASDTGEYDLGSARARAAGGGDGSNGAAVAFSAATALPPLL